MTMKTTTASGLNASSTGAFVLLLVPFCFCFWPKALLISASLNVRLSSWSMRLQFSSLWKKFF